jgi:hypothetical protein
MPNWCFNNLTVSMHNESGKKLVQAFRDNHTDEKGEKFSSPLTDLYPCPEELMATEASFKEDDPKHLAMLVKYGYRHWYEWRLANWGTKWDCAEVQIIDEDESYAQIRFDTAWCPPTNFFEWYAQQHPDVVFMNQYDEEGMGFEGYECHTPARGFVQESWEPVSNRLPDWGDLVDEIPKAVVEK